MEWELVGYPSLPLYVVATSEVPIVTLIGVFATMCRVYSNQSKFAFVADMPTGPWCYLSIPCIFIRGGGGVSLQLRNEARTFNSKVNRVR